MYELDTTFHRCTDEEVLEQMSKLAEMMSLQLEWIRTESTKDSIKGDLEEFTRLRYDFQARQEWIWSSLPQSDALFPRGNSYDHGYATDDHGNAIE